MNRRAMNLEFGTPYYNKSIDQCRIIGARGGRVRARNLRLQKATQVVPGTRRPEVETARQAIERIDALCPWLKGCELRSTRP